MRAIGNRQRSNWSYVLAEVVLIIAILVVLLPLVWVLLTSLKTRAEAYQIPPKMVFKPTLENYSALVEKYPFPLYMWNSLLISLITTAISLICGSCAAYSMSRFKTGGKFLKGWILNARTMLPMAIVLPFFMMFQKLNLHQTRTALVVTYLTFVFPLAVSLLLGFFESIPVELEEAAMVDGCTRLQALFRVVMPLGSPGLAATSILCFIFSWNEFLFALVLTGRETRTVPVAVSNFLTNQGVLIGELCAASMVLIIPAMVLAFSVRNYLVSGLTMGSVK